MSSRWYAYGVGWTVVVLEDGTLSGDEEAVAEVTAALLAPGPVTPTGPEPGPDDPLAIVAAIVRVRGASLLGFSANAPRFAPLPFDAIA